MLSILFSITMCEPSSNSLNNITLLLFILWSISIWALIRKSNGLYLLLIFYIILRRSVIADMQAIPACSLGLNFIILVVLGIPAHFGPHIEFIKINN